MRVISLQSGSNGNCLYVEAGDARLLFDAGISGKQAQLRLAEHGRDVAQVDAVLISHDHSDHVRCAGVFQRKFGLPIYATEPTLRAAGRYKLGRIDDVRPFASADVLRLAGVSVETIRTPHDATDGVVFVVDDGTHRLGILTDLGHPFDGLHDLIATLDAVVLESNYDRKMLAEGPYSELLQQRIAGPQGHLSNDETAELLDTAGGRLQWACLAHLSEDNNTPQLALAACRRELGDRLPLHVASRHRVGEELRV